MLGTVVKTIDFEIVWIKWELLIWVHSIIKCFFFGRGGVGVVVGR